MAAGDEASLRPTQGLLLREGRKHYRTQISPIHWQLRSLISTERDGIVYFPAGINNTHITRLDTKTRECETIKVITFHPRCLVASGGWICCGGEYGEFTIIHDGANNANANTNTNTNTNGNGNGNTNIHLDPIPSSSVSSSSPPSPPAPARANTSAAFSSEAISALASPSMTELRRDMLSIVQQLSAGVKTWSATNYKIGSLRVNCITIWLPPRPPSDPPRPGPYTYPVAVLANNDKTVTVVRLDDGEAVDTLEYPDCVNRCVISPDGSLLVTICDDPFLYVHVRRVPQGKRNGCHKWLPLPRIRLKDQSVRDVSDCRGSFAACFSPSGRYLAVGTQYGTISVFDVAAFADPERDPLITYFNSARAPSDCGAVRDMAFSPGPYDMLAWTEHRGRIGVADARTNFTTRQIISLEDPAGYDHLALGDRNTTIDPRLLDPRSERSAARSLALSGYLAQSGRSQPTTENPDITSRLNHSFTLEEMAVLEAVQNERRRREEREAWEHRDTRISQRARGSAAWRSSVFAAERVSPQQRTPANPRERERDMSERLQYLTSLQRDTLTRIFERDQNRENRDHQRSTPTTTQTAQPPPEQQDRERRAPTPRRRSSMMQALVQNADDSAQQTLNRLQRLGGGESTGAGAGAGASRDYSSLWGNPRSTSGWPDLEALYNMSGGDIAATNDATRTETSRIRRAIPVITDVWSDDASGFRRTYGRIGNREHPQHADDTAGLSWSEDGRTLYIGAEDGIYEFHINILSRKLFPAVTLR